ncbi:MAG: hypothetical protein K0S39_2394 [Paenibacillus sp.]|jgi:TolA-binding protein|nr:hypothetical protein [Paenibacillus sp.]
MDCHRIERSSSTKKIVSFRRIPGSNFYQFVLVIFNVNTESLNEDEKVRKTMKMKRAPRLLIWTVTAALTVPGVSLTDAAVYSAQAAAIVQDSGWSDEISRTVQEAKEAYKLGHAIPQELQERLTAVKDRLVETARNELTVRPGGAETNPSQHTAGVSPDWRFWAEAALPWKDAQMLDLLLDWTRAFPVDLYESELYVRLVAELLQDDQQPKLLQRLDAADRRGTRVLLNVLQYKGWLDESRFSTWLEVYSGKPQRDGIIDYLVYAGNNAELIRLYDGNELTPAQQQSVLLSIVSQPDYDGETRQWLQQLAASSDQLQVEQMIDQELVIRHGDRVAAERLYQSGMSHGFSVSLNGNAEKVLADMYPSGELAEGIRLYESVRGQPYFYGLNDRWYQADGADYANPEQAIGQWLDFLKRFPKHPAADDAAYRLARCYQFMGDGENALYWLNETVNRGDRDLGYDAKGMLLFVLDVEMSPEALAAVRTDRLPAWMKPWILYSQAVEYIRANRYHEAVQALHAFIDTYKGSDLFAESFTALNREEQAEVVYPEDHYPFWEQINNQLQLAERAAKLKEEADSAAGSDKSDKQYALAAMIYREPLFYYNHLWRETRQSFFWFGHIKEMNYYEPLDRYIGRFNHFIQAIDQFGTIDLQQANKLTAAKTLYSTALSYSRLTHYGEEVSFYMQGSRLNEKVAEYAKQLVESYPESELADDALMLLYHHTKDKQQLGGILTNYPEGDQAEEAKEMLGLLNEKESTQSASSKQPYEPEFLVRYERLLPGDSGLPSAVQQWVKEHSSIPYYGTMLEGEWVYVLLTADEGNTLDYMTMGSKNIQMLVTSQQRVSEPGIEDKRTMLVRVKKKFVHDGEWVWQIYRH